MSQGSRPDRIAEAVRQELSEMLLSEVRDPGIGLITLTRVKVSPDLQLVRVFYTIMGDAKEKTETKKALDRATPFLRRQLGARIRLRRVPELAFTFDETIEHQDRIERILLDLQRERDANAAANPEPGTGNQHPEPGTGNPEPEDEAEE